MTTVVAPQSSHLTSRFARRSFLPLKRDHLWFVKTGAVRTLTIFEEGTYVTLGLWGPGDVVGKNLSLADPLYIECLTPVEATLLPADNRQEVVEAMVLHIQRLGELMEILHRRQAETALLHLLAWLAKRFGQEVEQGQLIDLRLTHQDIAELVGLTRVTVTRLLSNFEKQGIIQRQGRQFIILQDQPPFWHYEI